MKAHPGSRSAEEAEIFGKKEGPVAKGRQFRDNVFVNPNFVRDSKLDAFFRVCLRSSRYAPRGLRPYDFVEGVVIRNSDNGGKNNDLILDLGPGCKFAARALSNDLRRMSEDYRAQFQVGTTCVAELWDLRQNGRLTPDEEDFLPVSLTHGRADEDLNTLTHMFRTDQVFEVTFHQAKRKGLVGRWGAVKVYLPFSHLPNLESRFYSEEEAQALLKSYEGHTLKVVMLRLREKPDEEIQSEIDSKIETAPNYRPQKWDIRVSVKRALLNELEIGQLVSATVTAVVEFGAFVDFTVEGNKFNGLIHKSEISWDWVDDPHDFLEVGQVVPAIITNIDYIENEISLSAKRVLEQPQRIQHFKPKNKKVDTSRFEDFEPEESVTDEELLDLADFVCEKLNLADLDPTDYLEKYAAFALILEAGLDKGWHELAIALRIRKAIINSANWREALEILEEGFEIDLSGHKASFTLFYFLVKRQNKE